MAGSGARWQKNLSSRPRRSGLQRFAPLIMHSRLASEVEIEALRVRFQKLAKRKAKPSDARARALKVIMNSGQLVAPADGMTLWQYFKPDQRTR